jgi:membrane-bound lytic murein transglycosylase B
MDKMIYIAIISLLSFFSSTPTGVNDSIPEQNTPDLFFKPVAEKLLTLGADSMFVYKLTNDPRISFDEKYTKIGVPTGKGGGSSNRYASHYNNTAVKKTKEFISEHDSLLSAAQSKYGVDKYILAALLYVETRHGNYLGNHNVPSVYMSLAMADQPEYIKNNLERLRAKHRGKSKTKMEELESKLMTRTETKSSWAIDQLLALEKIDSVFDISTIEGSHAGAFGISQFIPDSYVRWAVDGNGDGIVNLFEIEDAVFSAANYLNEHGWSDDPQDQYDAIWGYNHSSAYVRAIQKLASKVR